MLQVVQNMAQKLSESHFWKSALSSTRFHYGFILIRYAFGGSSCSFNGSTPNSVFSQSN